MLGLRTEVAATRERYEALRERLVRYDRALLRGAREERESAFAAYRSGELPLIAYLDFERALSESEVLIVRSRTDAAAAFATLMNGTAGAGLEVPSAPEAIP